MIQSLALGDKVTRGSVTADSDTRGSVSGNLAARDSVSSTQETQSLAFKRSNH